MDNNFDLKKLSKKFPEEDIEWRVQQCGCGNKGPWALIIPYITNRAIMARLDEAVGPGNWKNEYKESPCGTGYMCGISIKIDGEWITRWDGAEVTSGSDNIDKVKSTMSNSMKRAGVQWGIGRYLYQFEAMFADAQHCDNRYNVQPGWNFQKSKDKNTKKWFGFQWKAKPLEAWALPVTPNQIKTFASMLKEAKTMDDLKKSYRSAYNLAVSEGDNDLLAKFTMEKDEAKRRIIDSLEKQANDHKAEVESLVKSQIVIINAATNESTVGGLTNVAIDAVKQATNGKLLEDAIKTIKKSSNEKLNQLKGK